MKIRITFTAIFFCLSLNAKAQTTPAIDDLYAKKTGSLKMSSTRIDFGELFNNAKASDTIRILNTGKNPLSIAFDAKFPAHLSANVSAPVIPPGGKGFIAIRYDASLKNDFGYNMDMLQLKTNDVELPAKSIYVSAVIREFFQPGDSLPPKAKIVEAVYDFGKVKQGTKASHKFTVLNEGNKKLILHQAKTQCPCIKAGISKKELNPGDSTSVYVEFDTAGKLGTESRNVFLYVNDPAKPEVILELKGEVY